MRRGLVLLALTAAILVGSAPAALAHATCSSHTHWSSLTNYQVTSSGPSSCSGVIRKLTWRGWTVIGHFAVRR